MLYDNGGYLMAAEGRGTSIDADEETKNEGWWREKSKERGNNFSAAMESAKEELTGCRFFSIIVRVVP